MTVFSYLLLLTSYLIKKQFGASPPWGIEGGLYSNLVLKSENEIAINTTPCIARIAMSFII